MGGPPLVLPNRVKVGGSDINEEEKRNTSSSSMTPRPVKKKKQCYLYLQIWPFVIDDLRLG